jgi:hypothetical protein
MPPTPSTRSPGTRPSRPIPESQLRQELAANRPTTVGQPAQGDTGLSDRLSNISRLESELQLRRETTRETRLQGLQEPLTGTQRSRLFAKSESAARQAGRAQVGAISQRLGGDTSSPLFQFFASQAIGGARTSAAARRLDIDIEEARRSQQVGLETERLRQGFESLDLQRSGQGLQERLGFSAQDLQARLGFSELSLRAAQGQTNDRIRLLQLVAQNPGLFSNIGRGLGVNQPQDDQFEFPTGRPIGGAGILF